MLGREIKPTEAVSGTQAYGELSIGSVDQQERYTVMTDISKRNPDGEHCYSGSPIISEADCRIHGHKMVMPKFMNATVITDMLMVLKVRLEKVLAMGLQRTLVLLAISEELFDDSIVPPLTGVQRIDRSYDLAL